MPSKKPAIVFKTLIKSKLDLVKYLMKCRFLLKDAYDVVSGVEWALLKRSYPFWVAYQETAELLYLYWAKETEAYSVGIPALQNSSPKYPAELETLVSHWVLDDPNERKPSKPRSLRFRCESSSIHDLRAMVLESLRGCSGKVTISIDKPLLSDEVKIRQTRIQISARQLEDLIRS